MCGRFALDEKITDMEGFLHATNNFLDWPGSFSISPTDVIPIVRERLNNGEVVRSIDPAVWNFRPGWMKETKRPQFNSRVETVATLGLWKSAFASSRCIVPMRGYYEWTEREANGQTVKIPHFIHGPGDVLTAAGIYTVRKVGDEWEVSTSIITREGRDASGELHDRMPVFISTNVVNQWLDPQKLEGSEIDATLSMLTKESEKVAKSITTHEVDRKVNNSRTANPGDPSLIEPVAA